MARQKPNKSKNPDPQRYIEVRTREGSYFRLKRGLGKPAALNAPFEEQKSLIGVSSPAASELRRALQPYLAGLDTGRFVARVGAALKKALQEGDVSLYQYLLDYEVQPHYPLDRLLFSSPKVVLHEWQLTVTLALGPAWVKRLSRLVSHIYFELVLLQGTPKAVDERGVLDVDSVTSPLYDYALLLNTDCCLQLPAPLATGGPWLLLLKLCALEGNELANHPKHYGMKVIAVG